MKVIYRFKIANGVMWTTTLLVIQAVKCQILSTSIVDNVILYAILVGETQNTIAFHVRLMELRQVFTKEELFVLKSVEME